MHIVISNNALIEHHKTLQIKFGRYVLWTVPFLGWIPLQRFFPTESPKLTPCQLLFSELAYFLVGAVFYALLLIGHVLFRALSWQIPVE